MENKKETELAIYKQVCQVNDLDPLAIREKAEKDAPADRQENEKIELLIKAAFRHRANALVSDLDVASGGIADGKEYTADGDPAAPSFLINEDYIRQNYPADEAEKIIAALGQVQLPIRA